MSLRSHLLPLLAALAGGALACAATTTPPAVTFYDPIPGAVASPVFALTVNGAPLHVEKFGDVHYARFMLEGVATIELTTPGHTIRRATVSPLNLGIEPRRQRDSVRFTLSRPCAVLVKVDDFESFLLFADPPETGAPPARGEGIVNLADFLPADRDSALPVTAAIQSAIDHTSALNGGGAGGTLFVPDGLYYAAQLRLKSNVHLHLSSGAQIRAVTQFTTSNYPRQNGSDSSFLYIDSASSVRISGRGAIDGNGWNLRHANSPPNGGNCKLIRSRNSSDLLIEDVQLRDSARWTVHFLHSDRITVRRVKIVNDLRIDTSAGGEGSRAFVSNTDGIDIDASTGVLVDGCFIYTEDDALSPKVTNYMGLSKAASGLTLVNNVLWTHKAALKIGDEVLGDIEDVVFSHNEVIFADRFMALWAGREDDPDAPDNDDGPEDDGANFIRRVEAWNNRTEKIGHLDHRRFFYYRIYSAAAGMDDILVNGLYAASAAGMSSNIQGFGTSNLISNAAFRNIHVGGTAVTGFAGIPLVFSNNFYTNISFAAAGASTMNLRSGTPTVTNQNVPVPPNLPVVVIRASDDWGREGTDSVSFTLSRIGLLSSPLTVRLSATGADAAGADTTVPPPAFVTFPAGAQQVTLTLHPVFDDAAEGDEPLTLTLLEDTAYTLGTPASATAIIADVEPLALTLPVVDDVGLVSTTFRRPVETFGGTYTVETSTDLQQWTTTDVTLEQLASEAAMSTWRASAPITTTRFFRLRLSQP